MSLSRFAYRTAKRLLRYTPPWLFTVRPISVYQISTAELAGREDLPAGPPEEVIRWVGSPEEAMLLYGVADAENCAAWDARSRRAAIVIQDGAPIACVWVAAGEYHDPEIALTAQVGEDSRWLFAAVVDPRFRRAGVYRRLLRFVARDLHADGVERITLGVVAGNEASQRAHESCGAVRAGQLVAARLLGASWRRVSGGLELVTREEAGATVTALRVLPSATPPAPAPAPLGQPLESAPAE